MNEYKSPAYWLKSTMDYLADANREMTEAMESYLKAVNLGETANDMTGATEEIKMSFLKIFEMIFDATECVYRILRQIPEKDKEDENE